MSKANTVTIEEPKVFMAPPDTPPSSDEWIPLGSDTVKFTFVVEKNTGKLFAIEDTKPSDAACFDEWVRESHRVPDIRNTKLLKMLRVEAFGMRYKNSGNYAIAWVDFRDGSSWQRRGVIYD